MKKLILKTIFLLLLSVNIYGQSANEVRLDSLPQRGLYFCWAATFQMIMESQGVNKTQCELAYKLSRGFPASKRPKLACCKSLCMGDCRPYDKLCDLCDQPIPYRTAAMGISKCEEILNAFSFNATEKMNYGSDILSFSTIKAQIDADKPMAIVFTMTGADISGPHFTVLKGYKTTIGGDSFVSIFDPWRPCIGGTVLVNYRVFTGGGEGIYTWVESYIQDIRSRLQVRAMRQTMMPLDSTSWSDNSESLYKHGITQAIKQAEFNDLKIKTPVKYVSPNDLNYLIADSRDSCGRNSSVFDVSPTNDPSVMTTMQYIPRQEKWIPIEIKRYPYPTKLNVKVGNDIVTLNNSLSASNSQCFERIIISGTHYEFYRFVYRGKAYLLPIEQTSDLLINNRKTYQYSVYTASDMAKALKKALVNRPQVMRTTTELKTK